MCWSLGHRAKDIFVEAFEANINNSCLRPSELNGVARQQGDQPLVTHTRSFYWTLLLWPPKGVWDLLVILPWGGNCDLFCDVTNRAVVPLHLHVDTHSISDWQLVQYQTLVPETNVITLDVPGLKREQQFVTAQPCLWRHNCGWTDWKLVSIGMKQ